MIKKIYTTYKNSFSGLSTETWLLSIVMLINRSSSMAVPFMSLYMTQYLHRPPSDAGLIITSNMQAPVLIMQDLRLMLLNSTKKKSWKEKEFCMLSKLAFY